MGIQDRLIAIYRPSNLSISYKADSNGLGLFFDDKGWNELRNGKGGHLAQHQYVLLQMLLEQENAEEIKSGIYISTDTAISLDIDTRETFLLPNVWDGIFKLQTRGVTADPEFDAHLILVNRFGESIHHFNLIGPILKVSKEEEYLLDETQYSILSSYDQFRAIQASDRKEYDKLVFIHSLLSAREKGASVDIVGFNNLDVVKPETVGVAVNQLDDGGLELIPTFPGGFSPSDIKERLGRLSDGGSTGRLGIGRKIVLLDETRMRAVQEIIASEHIKPVDRKVFLANPTAWLDASLVDLDLGFSFRVRGAGPFKHAYFGETDESGIAWFDGGGKDAPEPREPRKIEPEDLGSVIRSKEDLEGFQRRLNDALAAGAESLVFKGTEVSLNDPEAISRVLSGLEFGNKSEDSGSGDEQEESEPTVIDIDDYDEDIAGRTDLETPEATIRSKRSVDYGAYSRTPYPHQKEAVSWLLGVAEEEWSVNLDEAPHRGALLADDMGLGKTFVSLVFIREYLEQVLAGQTKRPVLIVAPLVLLENWKREIAAAYSENYFGRVSILQAEADLPVFKIEGARTELTMNRSAIDDLVEVGQEPEMNRGTIADVSQMLEEIKYALKVGSSFGSNRLDMPNSIVLTTYQTLRDYQFSLGRVDWSVVIFDEAQNIKNPNALQSRAAKALKAKFKLVMTGTPVENHLGEFWCLFDTLQPGYLGAYQEFRTNYIKPILSASSENVQDVRVQVGTSLRDKVGGLMLRRIKEDHLEGLPEKRAWIGAYSETGEWTFDPSICREMNGEQLERYNAVVNTTIESMQEEEGRGQALIGLHKLRQVSLHPDLLAGGQPQITTTEKEARALIEKSGKLKVTLKLLETIRDSSEKAIIFLMDKKMQAALAIALRQIFHCEAAIINGDTKTFSKRAVGNTRQGIIDRFEIKNSFDVLIMSPIAAGVGLTIVGANHVIHLERHWNPAKEAQATDRVYRIGQKKNVNVYYPTLLHPTLDSFDVNLNRLLSSKQGLKDAIIIPSPVSEEEMTGSGIFGKSQDGPELALTIDKIDSLNWEMFEAFVACLFSRDCVESILTKRGRDKGADTVVVELNGSLTLIQTKFTAKTKRLDGYKAITEVYGAVPYFEEKLNLRVKRRLVVTNAKSYSGEAKILAKTFNVELLTRKDISRMLNGNEVRMSGVLRFNQKRRAI